VLALNLKRYALSNALVETYALGDTEGEAQFFENDCGNLGNSTLEPREAAGKNMIVTRVPVRTGDKQFVGETPDFIKIDVEGFEPKVLQGLRETLNRHRPVLMVEVKVFEANVDLTALLPPNYTFHVITSDLAGMRRLKRRLALWRRGGEKYSLQQVSGVFERGDDAVFCIPTEALTT
jgi:FkbM family methyltransferase